MGMPAVPGLFVAYDYPKWARHVAIVCGFTGLPTWERPHGTTSIV